MSSKGSKLLRLNSDNLASVDVDSVDAEVIERTAPGKSTGASDQGLSPAVQPAQSPLPEQVTESARACSHFRQLLFKLAGTGTRLILGWLFKFGC